MGSKTDTLACESSEDALSLRVPKLVQTVVIQCTNSTRPKRDRRNLNTEFPLVSCLPTKPLPTYKPPKYPPKAPHFQVYSSYLDAICAVAGRILSSLVSTDNPLAKHVLL